MIVFGRAGEVVAIPGGPNFVTVGLPSFNSAGNYSWGTVDRWGRVVAARDVPGLPGARGATGAIGLTGLTGPTGATGASGGGGGAITYPAGEAIGSPRVVMLVGGQLFLFDPSVEDNIFKLVGVSTNSAIIGDPVGVVADGVVSSAGSFVTDGVYFVGSLGVLTMTVPTSGIIVKMGIASSTGSLNVEMSEPLIMA